MINTSRFTWKDNGTKLHHGKKYTGFSIGQSCVEPTMFHVVWPDKTPSKDYYNLPRAKDHCKAMRSKHLEGAETDQGSSLMRLNEK